MSDKKSTFKIEAAFGIAGGAIMLYGKTLPWAVAKIVGISADIFTFMAAAAIVLGIICFVNETRVGPGFWIVGVVSILMGILTYFTGFSGRVMGFRISVPVSIGYIISLAGSVVILVGAFIATTKGVKPEEKKE